MRTGHQLGCSVGELSSRQTTDIGERLQSGQRNVRTVHLEELAQRSTCIAAPEAIGAQRNKSSAG